MHLKCITLHQPHASLVVARLKPIETRTHDRFSSLIGKTIGIHAGLQDWPLDPQTAQRPDIQEFMKQKLPHGVILCTVKILRMRRLTPNDSFASCVDIDEQAAKRLWGYELEVLNVFDEPKPAKGRQGIWTYCEADE